MNFDLKNIPQNPAEAQAALDANPEGLDGGIRAEAAEAMIAVAAGLKKAQAAVYISIVAKLCKIPKVQLNEMLADFRTNENAAAGSEKLVYVDEPVGIWGPKVAASIADHCYISNGEVCTREKDGLLSAKRDNALHAFLDHPDRVVFVDEDGYCGGKKSYSTQWTGWLESDGKDLPCLRHVDVVHSIPLLANDEGSVRIVSGYDAKLRAIAGEGAIEELTLDESKRRLGEILCDFRYPTKGDEARVITMFLSPALLAGDFTAGRAPFFLIQKDQAQAGGGTMLKVLNALYAQKASNTINGVRNPDKFEEQLISKLAAGHGVINLDNISGDTLKKASALLSSAITEPTVTGRVAFETMVTVNMSKRMFVGTTNSTEISQEMATRTMLINLLKQDDGYTYRFPHEGDIERHVAQNRCYYLSAIYSLIRIWHGHGCAMAPAKGFRQSAWAAAAGGVIACCYHGYPLPVDGLKEQQANLSSATYKKLRDVVMFCARTIRDEEVSASTIIERMEDEEDADNVPSATEIGRAMSTFFGGRGSGLGAVDTRMFEGVAVTRTMKFLSPTHPEGTPMYRFTANSTTNNNLSVQQDQLAI